MRHVGMAAALVLLLAITSVGAVEAAPKDAKPGAVRAVFSREGTPLRANPSALSPAVATLAYATQVVVEEAKLPWMRVRTVAPRGQAPQRGWLRAFDTVEPAALAPNPRPVHLDVGSGGGVSAKTVSAASRQFDAANERGYRASRQDLAQAYAAVDRMEAATQLMDPGESIAFIAGGSLGRMGRSYARPARLPAVPVQPTRPRRSRPNVGGVLGRIGGEVLKRGGVDGRVADAVSGIAGGLVDYSQQMAKAFTPGQEYYLGRAVAANAIAKYGVDPDQGRRHYVRLVGDAVVRLTARLPANYGGYHFEVLNSDEVNAVSGPGGFVLITRGAVEACTTESELAGVLGHELAHIKLKHGEGVLREGDKFKARAQLLGRVASSASGLQDRAWVSGLLQLFTHAASRVSTTAIEHRYGRRLEFAADAEGTYLTYDVFYDHAGLNSYLGRLVTRTGLRGAAATHWPPQVRVAALRPVLARYRPFQAREGVVEARIDRFHRSLGHAATPR